MTKYNKTITILFYSIIIIGIAFWHIATVDFSDTEAQVKVQEVGTRYAFLNIGEQQYIRIQNAYSDQYASSSEVWETCISPKDYKWFKEAKNKKDIINIRVKGNGISTTLTCITGDKAVQADK